MKNMSQKTKFRVTFLMLCSIIAVVLFVSQTFSYVSVINKNKKEILALEKSYNDALAEEEELKEQINKLQDPEYMAKYAREKYLYSKDDEIVIRLEE